MDQFNGRDRGSGNGSDQHPNLSFRDLLGDSRLASSATAEEAAALLQFATSQGTSVFPERSATLHQAGFSGFNSLHHSSSEKRNIGYGLDSSDHYDLSFQTGGGGTYHRPDPPSAQGQAKRPRLHGVSDLEMLLSNSAAATQFSFGSSLFGSGRDVLQSFASTALQQHQDLQQRNNPFLNGSLAAMSANEAPTPSALPSGKDHEHALQLGKEGIFDDRDTESEASDVFRQNININQAKTPFTGGIFDDAEEEETFVPPRYASEAASAPKKPKPPPMQQASSSLPKAAPKKSPVKKPTLPKAAPKKPTTTKPATKKDTTTAKPATKKDTPPAKPAAKKAKKKTTEQGSSVPSPEPTSNKEDGAKEPPPKKKKPLKPTKRVLVARKEKDLATALMEGKEDLREVIQTDHCHFLGKECWIFTVQQLDSVLDGTNLDSTEAREASKLRRRELLVQVALNKLWDKPYDSAAVAESHVPMTSDTQSQGGPAKTVAEGAGDREESVDGQNESSTSNEKDEVEDFSQVTLHPQAEEMAEYILRTWKEKIAEWKKKDQAERDIPLEKRFPLDGPISCLFPTNIQRFLASVPMRSLYEFLCVKKTETGAIIALCGVWRKECGLVAGAPLALAKHLLGIGLRAESAITATPPLDARTRKWMGDPIVVLTGAAREFLIEERKVLAGKTFIDTRTKDLANALMEWRTSKGLPPLKGSGKVAMVSGWKANVKEAIDLEENSGRAKVLDGTKLRALAEVEEKAPIVKEEKKPEAPAKPVPAQKFTFDPKNPEVESKLKSEKFLQEVLDPKHFEVLQTAGIKTAVELFAAQKKHGSPLAFELQKALPDPSTFELVIFDWCQIVRKKLSSIRKVQTKRKGDPLPNPPPAKKEKTAKKEKKEKPAEPKKSSQPPRPSKQALLEKDPFYSLSAVTQTFLKTLGIETAEAFMASRTTDLSSAFVEWRQKNNMSVLKGLGAIASVSGWKAQIRKMATERGLDDLAAATPQGVPAAATTTAPKAKASPEEKKVSKTKKPEEPISTPVKATTSITKMGLGVEASQTVLSCPDVLFGRPSKKLVVESARDPRIRFYFELSIRKKAKDICLFISYIGARKLSTVHSDYSRIHQRNFSIVRDDDSVADVSLLVAKDLSKKIKKDPNSTSAAGKNVRLPFSSLEDGCGLIELCKHDVWPLPCEGEASSVWPAIESFIHQEETSNITFSSNVVVGKDENGRSQYFLYLNEPLERGQTVQLHFCRPQGTPSSRSVRLDFQWRRNVEGILSRLSRQGLRTLLQFVTRNVVEKINKAMIEYENEETISNDPGFSSGENVFVSRRRAHWIAFKIISQLHGQETKGAKTKSGGAGLSREITESYKVVAWTPELVALLKKHPKWNDSTVDLIKKEIQHEFEAGILSNEFLNSGSRGRWCSLANELFDSLKPRIQSFSGFLEPTDSQEELMKAIQESALAFARRLREGQGDNLDILDHLVMTFTEFTDGMPCASPSLEHVFHTSVEQAYKDALALCNTSAAAIAAPKEQRVIATSEKASTDEDVAAAPKTGKEASKKPEEASFRTVEDVRRGHANVHRAWYIKFQLLQVLKALLSVSSVLVEGGVPLKNVVIKAVESALVKDGVEELSKFDKSTLSVLAGTPVTFPSEVSSSEYQPKSLPLFLGLVWPLLRSSHWRVEAGDIPSDVSFLPPGQTRSRRQRNEKRTKMLKQDRTRSRLRMAKASSEIGLGSVSKLTKRLFVNAVNGKLAESEASEDVCWPSVDVALDRFLSKVKSDMGDEKVDGHKRTELVVKYTRDAFNALKEQEGDFDSTDGRKPSETLGCEHLARFVLLAPSILCQTQLSAQIVEDTTLVLKELAAFLSSEHMDLFAPSFCPPNEVYISEKDFPTVLASCLENPRSVEEKSTNMGEMTEAITPEDRLSITEFVQVVMSQVIPCRATEEDIAKKNRRISLGYIGLSCKHCMGAKGEGRYFFTSIESITTAATVIEKHIQKCTMVPPDIKAQMAVERGRHAEQRKIYGQGAQAAYFLRLWKRLRSSKVRNTSGALHIMELEDFNNEDDEDDAVDGLEFSGHVEVIEHIKKTQPWSEKSEIMEALRQYYEGIELGGRFFSTDAMPPNFNSEWLLGKVLAAAPEPKQESSPTSVGKPPNKTSSKQSGKQTAKT